MAETFQPLNPVADAAQDGPSAPDEPLWRNALGERLRAARRERGETLAETADRAGISPQYLSEIERGLKEPSSEMIAAVAGALETTLGDLARSIAERLLLEGARRRRRNGRGRPRIPKPDRGAGKAPAPDKAAALDETAFQREAIEGSAPTGATLDSATLNGAALETTIADSSVVERADGQSGPTCRATYALVA